MDAAAWIEALGLERHPEGGWYRRQWTHPEVDAEGRARASSIHYLLAAGERSHWHRVDAAETWCWHAGGAIELHRHDPGTATGDRVTLGPDVGAGHRLQHTVPPGWWQSARLAPGAPFVVVSCVVVPEFRMEGFELAPPGWTPPGPGIDSSPVGDAQ